jgi:hypothetical protein
MLHKQPLMGQMLSPLQTDDPTPKTDEKTDATVGGIYMQRK